MKIIEKDYIDYLEREVKSFQSFDLPDEIYHQLQNLIDSIENYKHQNSMIQINIHQTNQET
jgi:hypothetical protein